MTGKTLRDSKGRFVRGNKNCVGREISEKTRKKISKSITGIKQTKETIEKRINSRKGYKHSENTKRKMSEAQKGEKNGNWKGGMKAHYKRKYYKVKNNLKLNLNHRISNLVLFSLKNGSKNGRTWQSLVPYNLIQLKNHLKNTMPIGYTWQDFLNGDLHIDHIIPIDTFDFDKPEDLEFKKCWALDNLRLLPKFENISKHNKIIKSYQTNLKIAI